MSLFGDRILGRGVRDGGILRPRPESPPGPVRWEPVDAAAWYAADFMNTLRANSEGTGGVENEDDPIGRWIALAGGPDADGRDRGSSLRPIFKKLNGKPSVFFLEDGSYRPALRSLNVGVARNVGQVVIMAVVTPTVDASRLGAVWVAENNPFSGNGFRSHLRRFSGQWGTGGRRLDGDSFQEAGGGTVGIGKAVAIVGILDYQNAIASLYINGALVATADPFHTGGNTQDTDSRQVGIGAYITGLDVSAENSYVLNGGIHELVIKNSEIPNHSQMVDFWVHARDFWGVTLNS